VDALAKKYKLLNAFFDELVAYKKAAGELAKKGKKGKSKKKTAATRYTHMEHIQTRLDFLYFILSNSSLHLTVEHVDILWDSLIVNALQPEEREACFSWLEKSRQSKTEGSVVWFYFFFEFWFFLIIVFNRPSMSPSCNIFSLTRWQGWIVAGWIGQDTMYSSDTSWPSMSARTSWSESTKAAKSCMLSLPT